MIKALERRLTSVTSPPITNLAIVENLSGSNALTNFDKRKKFKHAEFFLFASSSSDIKLKNVYENNIKDDKNKTAKLKLNKRSNLMERNNTQKY